MLSDRIARLGSVEATLTRTPRGTTTLGRYTAGATTTQAITVLVQPVKRDLAGDDTTQDTSRGLVVFSTEAVTSGDGINEADKLTIGGINYRAVRVLVWTLRGSTHYQTTLEQI